LGVTLKLIRDLPLKTDHDRRIRNQLLRRLLLVPSVLLLLVGGVLIHFLFAAVPAAPARWLAVLLAAAGTGVGLAGYWMAANLATHLQLTDTELQQMRTQLIQTGKMARLGEMSTGIAHEINNPLQVVISELALIQAITEDLAPVIPEDDAQKTSMLKESTEVIGHQIKRCSKITQKLIDFSRGTESALP
jgi:signal transduction histidine kinase